MHGLNTARLFTHSSSLGALTRNSIKVMTGLSLKANFNCRFLKKDDGTLTADTTITKHKEDKVKYLVLQLENIKQDSSIETVS